MSNSEKFVVEECFFVVVVIVVVIVCTKVFIGEEEATFGTRCGRARGTENENIGQTNA